MIILEKQISPEAKAKIEITGGKLSIKADLDTQGVDAVVAVSVDTDYFCDELAKKIPGTIDDAFLSILKAALKSL